MSAVCNTCGPWSRAGEVGSANVINYMHDDQTGTCDVINMQRAPENTRMHRGQICLATLSNNQRNLLERGMCTWPYIVGIGRQFGISIIYTIQTPWPTDSRLCGLYIYIGCSETLGRQFVADRTAARIVQKKCPNKWIGSALPGTRRHNFQISTHAYTSRERHNAQAVHTVHFFRHFCCMVYRLATEYRDRLKNLTEIKADFCLKL